MKNKIKKVGVIGLGLIGGSIAKSLKQFSKYQLLGFDNSDKNILKAKELELIHQSVSYEALLRLSDIILIAVPIDNIIKILPDILDQITDDKIVIDVGSTKSSICESVSKHSRRRNFVAAHPMAGTENSGPEAAFLGLFDGKKNIICNPEESAPQFLQEAISLFGDLKMQTFFLDCYEHDKHMAYVSHLSHVISFMLSNTVLEIEKDHNQIFNLASTGFESTVRLAKSNPITWNSIFQNNKKDLVDSIDHYIENLFKFKDVLINGESHQLINMMTKSNEIKKVLNQIKLNPVKN